MKTQWLHLLTAFWFVSQIGVYALDPTEVDGAVTVKVDRSERIWLIAVTNNSEQKLSYEMMGRVPRGLGLEVWDDGGQVNGWRVHAEDLAEYLNVDGFPADIREIPPGGSAEFQLNPESMSTTEDLALAKWERAKRNGYYTCRVFFGVYASRLIDISPRPGAKAHGNAAQDQDAQSVLADAVNGAEERELFGFRLRRMLNENNLALVDWHSMHTRDGKEEEIEITYMTCAKDDLERLPDWDERKPIDPPFHKLVATAHAMAREKLKECSFEGVMINPCEDDRTKHFASFYFANDRDDVTIHLLLNGAPTNTTSIVVTKEQYEELVEYRVPKLREQGGPGQPATHSEADSEGDVKPKPESEGRSR